MKIGDRWSIMVDGVQTKKFSVRQLVDSMISDQDLISLADGDLAGLCQSLFAEDWRVALEYAFRRRDDLLDAEDQRKYQRLYHAKRKGRERRIYLRLNYERDADILDWINGLDDYNAVIRQVLREHVGKEKGAN